jgi:hypothetical protein
MIQGAFGDVYLSYSSFLNTNDLKPKFCYLFTIETYKERGES